MVEVDWENEAVDRDRRVQLGEDRVTQRRRHFCGVRDQVRLRRASRRDGLGEPHPPRDRVQPTCFRKLPWLEWFMSNATLSEPEETCQRREPFPATGAVKVV
jgi:hypothetical protein